jgi:CheY-like chemotaxis protein
VDDLDNRFKYHPPRNDAIRVLHERVRNECRVLAEFLNEMIPNESREKSLAITKVEEQLVEIIDVEKVLAEIITYDIRISEEVLDREILPEMHGRKVLIVDDSSTARNLVRETLGQLGLEVIECQDGLQALTLLKGWCDAGKKVTDEILLMITDAEMPEMDGLAALREWGATPAARSRVMIDPQQDMFAKPDPSGPGRFFGT